MSRNSTRRSLAYAALGVVLAAAPCLSAFAQAVSNYRPSQAADGYPDLQGVWFFDWVTTLERPPEATGPTVSGEDINRLSHAIESRRDAKDPLQGFAYGKTFFSVHGEMRTSLIVDPEDGRIPYTPLGQARLARLLEAESSPPDGPEALPPNVRCLIVPGGGPYLPFPAQNFLRVIQTPTDIVLHMELMSSLRVIPLDGRPQPISAPQEKVSARWEGDTLIVQSTGFRGPLRGARGIGSVFLVTPATKMTEQFERIAPDEIDYTFTIEDSDLYTRAWTAEMIFRRTDEPTFENACHEGNYSLANILAGARVGERREGFDKSATRKGD